MYTPKELPIEEGSMLEFDVVITDDDRPIDQQKTAPTNPYAMSYATQAASGTASETTTVAISTNAPVNHVPRKFQVRIRRAGIVIMDTLQSFLNGKLDYTPLDALQAIDVLMRQRPSMLLTTVGRSFFTRNDVKMLGDGAECWMGFHQSVRPTRGKLLVNVDVSATAFFEPGTLTLTIVLFTYRCFSRINQLYILPTIVRTDSELYCAKPWKTRSYGNQSATEAKRN